MTSFFNSFYHDRTAAAIWAESRNPQNFNRYRHHQQQHRSSTVPGGCKGDDVTRTGLAMMAAARAAAQQYSHHGPMDWSLRVAADCNRFYHDVTMKSSSTTAPSGLVENTAACTGGCHKTIRQYGSNNWSLPAAYPMHPYTNEHFDVGDRMASLPVQSRDSPLSAVGSTLFSDADTAAYRSSVSQLSTCGLSTSPYAKAATLHEAPSYPWMNIVGRTFKFNVYNAGGCVLYTLKVLVVC